MSTIGRRLYHFLFPQEFEPDPPGVEGDDSYRIRLLREIRTLSTVTSLYSGDRLDLIGSKIGMARRGTAQAPRRRPF